MDLVRDLLDKQLIDDKDDPMGKVDGVVLDLGDGTAPPRVVRVESGFPVLARRMHPRLEKLVRRLGRRFGIRRGRVYRIAMSKIVELEEEVRVKGVDADRSAANKWENWLRTNIVQRIPGGKSGGEKR